jgi:hypothetical protein
MKSDEQRILDALAGKLVLGSPLCPKCAMELRRDVAKDASDEVEHLPCLRCGTPTPWRTVQ